MPRRRAKPLFEFAGQWIAKEPGSPVLYRFWTEPGSGRTRRQSLRTADLEDAKRVFAVTVLEQNPSAPGAPLSLVLKSYFETRTDCLPSAKHARLAGRTLLECWGETTRATDIDEAKQKHFAEWSAAKGHSLSYISRNLSVLAAAISQAGIAIKVRFGKSDIAGRWNLRTKAPRRRFVPTDDDLARLFAVDLPQDFFRWCVMSALTGGRPEAVLQLTPAARIREADLLDLNPAGRSQNKKFRPVVKVSPALAAWMDRWESEMRVDVAKRTLTTPAKADISAERYCGYTSVESVQTAICRAREKAGLLLFSAYSFRHKHVTVLRQARVPEDEIAIQIGHKRPGLEVTAGYGEWSPDYLDRAVTAIEAWWRKLSRAIPRLSPQRIAKSMRKGGGNVVQFRAAR